MYFGKSLIFQKIQNIKLVFYQNKQMGEAWWVGLSNLFSKKKIRCLVWQVKSFKQATKTNNQTIDDCQQSGDFGDWIGNTNVRSDG